MTFILLICSFCVSPEQHQVHWLLTHVVKFVQITLNNSTQLVQVLYFRIRLGISFWICEIAVDQTAQVILFHAPVLIGIEALKQFVKFDTKVRLAHLSHEAEKPVSVCVIHKTVIIHTVHLKNIKR